MKSFYHRKLPHWIPAGSQYFITFRLVNSLPLNILRQLQAEKEHRCREIINNFIGPARQKKLYEAQKIYFAQFDAYLDRCLADSPNWLGNDAIAAIVAENIRALDGLRYDLKAFCIMPNHVHLLIDTSQFNAPLDHQGKTADYPLTDTLRLLKGHTSRLCNQALARSGKFWPHESYDHLVRDGKELERIVFYIADNPVKAGLVKHWQDWRFTYVATDLSLGLLGK